MQFLSEGIAVICTMCHVCGLLLHCLHAHMHNIAVSVNTLCACTMSALVMPREFKSSPGSSMPAICCYQQVILVMCELPAGRLDCEGPILEIHAMHALLKMQADSAGTEHAFN